MFCCMGEPQNPTVTFHEDGYLRKNDIEIFKEEHHHSSVFVADFGSQVLFNRRVDKGSALVLNMDSLFNLAKYVDDRNFCYTSFILISHPFSIRRFYYIQLDSASKLNARFGTNTVSKQMIASAKCREDIVNFLLYVRNYIQRFVYHNFTVSNIR